MVTYDYNNILLYCCCYEYFLRIIFTSKTICNVINIFEDNKLKWKKKLYILNLKFYKSIVHKIENELF